MLPGSKSLTNRYLVLAALAERPVRLRAPLRSRDTLLMADALRALGVRIDDVAAEGEPAVGEVPDWVVTPPETLRGDVARRLRAGRHRHAVPAGGGGAGRRAGAGSTATRRRGCGRWAPSLDALRTLGVRVDDDGRAPAGHRQRHRVACAAAR